jgi:CBS domain-containing protein
MPLIGENRKVRKTQQRVSLFHVEVISPKMWSRALVHGMVRIEASSKSPRNRPTETQDIPNLGQIFAISWFAEGAGGGIMPDQRTGHEVNVDVNRDRGAPSRGGTGLLPLREIMSTRVVTIAPGEAASEAWNRMRRRRIRHLVVLEGSRVIGVVSERDLGGRAGADVRKSRTVQDLMTPHVLSADSKTTLNQAADVMRKQLIGCLPVLEGDQLAGLVTATDVFETLGSSVIGTMSRAERQLLRAPSSSRRLGGQPVISRRSRASGKMSEERLEARDNKKRVPFADRLPRALKRKAGRTDLQHVPANIRVVGVELDQDQQQYIRQALGMKLGKFVRSIERISVRLKDVNGPRGGVDQLCRIKVVLSGLPSVVFQTQAGSLRDAISGALTGVQRAVRRSVQRRRMKALKRRKISRLP